MPVLVRELSNRSITRAERSAAFSVKVKCQKGQIDIMNIPMFKIFGF